MSKEVLSAINHSYDLASYTTLELRGLFNDWIGEIELRVVAFVNKRQQADPQELADHFKLTTKSIIFVLGKLAREGRITMEAEDKAKGKLHLLKRE